MSMPETPIEKRAAIEKKAQVANYISDMQFQHRTIEESIDYLADIDNAKNTVYCSVNEPSVMMLRDWLKAKGRKWQR
jgi:hypothetical protein